jgi:hypothetical protein
MEGIMTVINQTAALSGVSSGFGLFVGMVAVGLVIIILVWIFTHLYR